MIGKKVEAAINKQINEELYSAYLYLSMAGYCDSLNLKGFTNWMRIQFQEEQAHAMLLYDFLQERGGTVVLETINKPPVEWNGIIDMFENVLKHEQMITGLINDLVDMGISEKDHATVNFLQWFVEEQVEEEANATDVLDQIKMTEGKGPGMFMLDREMRTRVFTPPKSGE